MSDQNSNSSLTEEVIYNPAMSTSGVLNRYYMHCDTVGHQIAYAVCLNHIATLNRGEKLSSCYDRCSNAIAKKTCPALGMREQELYQGKAIYFIKREITPSNYPKSDPRPLKVTIPAVAKSSTVKPIAKKPEPLVTDYKKSDHTVERSGKSTGVNLLDIAMQMKGLLGDMSEK